MMKDKVMKMWEEFKFGIKGYLFGLAIGILSLTVIHIFFGQPNLLLLGVLCIVQIGIIFLSIDSLLFRSDFHRAYHNDKLFLLVRKDFCGSVKDLNESVFELKIIYDEDGNPIEAYGEVYRIEDEDNDE